MFRTSGVRISGANFTPPNALLIDELVTELIDWTNSSDLNIVIKAAIFHHRFVWIHPFLTEMAGPHVCFSIYY